MIQGPTAPKKPRRLYAPRGACLELFNTWDREVLIEGPAGTGKTRAVLEKAVLFSERYPHIRVLLARKTRKSLTDSVLEILENKVLGEGHEAIVGEATRDNRVRYVFPNGSEMVCAGMDRSSRIMSTEWDLIFVFEATELTMGDWEDLTTRARNHAIPHPHCRYPHGVFPVEHPLHGITTREAVGLGYYEGGVDEDGAPLFFEQCVADCNPGQPQHFLNVRAMVGDTGKIIMRRLQSKHTDNPTVSKAYLQNLHNLKGARKARLLEGRWVAEEGLVYDDFDTALHCIHASQIPRLAPTADFPDGALNFKWSLGSIDWGYRRPGVFQIWGVDPDDRMFLVREVYQTERQTDWWAEEVSKGMDEFGIRTVVCDPSRPGDIDLINGLLERRRGRAEDAICIPADNAIEAGVQLVQWFLKPQIPDERQLTPTQAAWWQLPRMFFVWEALYQGCDPALSAKHMPTSTIQEFTQFVWRKTQDGQVIKEQPDPLCEDHGMDAMRYAAMHVHKSRNEPAFQPFDQPLYEERTMGHLMGHEDVLQRGENWYPGMEDGRKAA